MTANSPAYRSNFGSYIAKKLVDGTLPIETLDRLKLHLRQDYTAGAISAEDYAFCHELAIIAHYGRIAA